MNINFKLLSFLSLIVVFTSCGVDEPIERTAETTFGIRHDKNLSDYENSVLNATNDHPNFNSVVCFNYSLDGSTNYEFVATGTLISSEWILTAGHNFFVSEEQKTPATPAGISVLIGNDPNNPSKKYEVESITFHPTWLGSNDGFANANDYCLVKLKTPITDLTPVELYKNSTEAIGSKVWYCGYGDYSKLAGQNPDLLSIKHAIENNLDRKNEGIVSTINGKDYNGGLLAFDFDNPQGTINSLGDAIINADEATLGSGTSDANALDLEGTTVQGDSGGPLFVKEGNTWKLAGVLSGGAQEPIADHKDGSYGDISLFMRVSTNLDWIESVIK